MLAFSGVAGKFWAIKKAPRRAGAFSFLTKEGVPGYLFSLQFTFGIRFILLRASV